MATIWMDGFGNQIVGGGHASTFMATTLLHGSINSDRQRDGRNTWGLVQAKALVLPLPSISDSIVCFYVFFVDGQEDPNLLCPFDVFWDAGSDTTKNFQACRLEFNVSTHNFEFTDNASNVTVNDTFSWVEEVWYRIELKLVGSDTAGTFEMTVDGTKIIDVSGADTLDSGDTYRRLDIRAGTGSSDAFLSDLVIRDTTGSFNNDIIGQGWQIDTVPCTEVELQGTYLPIGGGTVDDIIANIPFDKDSYTVSDSSLTRLEARPIAYFSSDTIGAVQANVVCAKEDAGTLSFDVGMVDGEIEVSTNRRMRGVTITDDKGAFKYSHPMDTAPDGGSWTFTDVRDNHLFIEITGIRT